MDEVWDGEDLKSRLKNAGLESFAAIRQYQFEATQVMMSSASLYIKENKAALVLNQNMAEDYPEEFEQLKVQFQTLYGTYLDRINHSGSRTKDVIQAMNGMYEDLTGMFADARVIFRKQPDLSKRFAFENVMNAVRSNGWAGIKGSITVNGLPYKPVDGLLITLLETEEQIEAEEEGRFQFDQLKAGIYSVEITAPGYIRRQYEGIEVKAGAYTTFSADLETEAALEEDAKLQPPPVTPPPAPKLDEEDKAA